MTNIYVAVLYDKFLKGYVYFIGNKKDEIEDIGNEAGMEIKVRAETYVFNVSDNRIERVKEQLKKLVGRLNEGNRLNPQDELEKLVES